MKNQVLVNPLLPSILPLNTVGPAYLRHGHLPFQKKCQDPTSIPWLSAFPCTPA